MRSVILQKGMIYMLILLEELKTQGVSLTKIDNVTYAAAIDVDGETLNAEYKINYKGDSSIKRMGERIEKRADASKMQLNTVELAVDTSNENKLILLAIHIHTK